MGRGDVPPLRALPRAFVPGIPDPLPARIDLPDEEIKKFRSVLRLSSGHSVALLPGDGRVVTCRLDGNSAVPVETAYPDTEPTVRLTLALALSKPEALEDSVRMASELGAARFILFPSDRSVVRWDADKTAKKIQRLASIAREAAEVSFRTKLPEIHQMDSLSTVLNSFPEALVLSESDSVLTTLSSSGDEVTLVIGPEGGWSPRESALIGDRAVTLGRRVLRVSTAVATAAALVLSNR